MVRDFKQRFWISIVVTLPVLFFSPFIQDVFGIGEDISFTGERYVLFIFSSFIFVYGGYPFLRGFYSELREKSPGMMTLIALAVSVAYLYSSAVVFGLKGKFFFWELVTLIDIMLLGHWIEMKSVMGASKALEELARLLPSEAHVAASGGEIKDVPLDEVKKGDLVIVKPGEKIPADGEIVDGGTSVNEAMITGESMPVEKQKGNKVIGGSVNGEGSITVVVQKTGEDSYLSQMVETVKEAQQSKSKTQNLADRAAFYLTIIALSAGTLTFLVWLLAQERELTFSLERAMTVMVITCPHALGLAIPLVVAVSTTLSAKHGLLIRNRTSFERARKIQAIIFDKTGTLTEGRFGVTDVVPLGDGMDKDRILQYAASIEKRSEHPIARGIVNAANDTFPVEEFKAIPGKGARGKVKGKEVMIVSMSHAKEEGFSIDDEKIDHLLQQGKTVSCVIIDGALKGVIALADIIREDSRKAVSRLKEMGIECMMLTGDNEGVARWVAGEIGLDEYFSGVSPDEKSSKVKEIQERGLVVAMTGDGVNDAPALAQADVGIAIGAGTDVAFETADIVLVRSNPLDAVSILRFARATYKKMIQNLLWATGYNAIAIPLAAGILFGAGIVISPAVGAILMSLSTVIVAINARIMKVE